MNALDVAALTKSYGPTRILDGITFTLGEDEKVGVVGRNGCGKSTLFRVLAGLEEADAGRIVRRRGLTVGHLPQRPDLDPEASVRQVLEAHLGEQREKLLRHRALADAVGRGGGDLAGLLREQEEVHAWLDHHGAWTLDHRLEEVCSRFGIPDPDVRVGTLSGGWSQRVALAGILLARPDLLLLDEPTNQLDAETVEWLEDVLRGYRGAVLLVTHDRYFLDRVVTRMLELESGGLTAYAGGYGAYLEQKAERLAREERTQARLLNLLRREEAWLTRGAKARTTKQKARIDRAEALRDQVGTTRSRELSLDLSAGTNRARDSAVLTASGLAVAAGARRLVTGLEFTLRQGERVGVLGPNGCGKTSLVRTLVGESTPAAGGVALAPDTRVGYLDQARTGLDDVLSVAEALGPGDWVQVGGPRGERRHKVGYLEEFLFRREDHVRPVATLSGGERARLLLARLLLLGANLLVLDEPTNDLDIPTLEVLDEALATYPGAALVVTHDRYFLDRVATGILHFEGDGRVVYYEGNYEVFTRLRPRPQAPVETPKKRPPVPPTRAPKPASLSYRERRELEEVEREIGELEARQAEVEVLLADPGRLEGGHREIQDLAAELEALGARLAALMDRWEELESKRCLPGVDLF